MLVRKRRLRHKRKLLSKILIFLTVLDYDVPVTTERCRQRIREEFEKNRHINDVRAIDLLVVKVK